MDPIVPDDDFHSLVPDHDMNGMDSVPLEMPEPPEQATRQRAIAQVRSIAISEVVRDIAGRHPFQTVQQMDTTHENKFYCNHRMDPVFVRPVSSEWGNIRLGHSR